MLVKSICLISCCVLFQFAATAQSLVLEGHYLGKNLYIQNPFSGDGVSFCAKEVKVNGKVAPCKTESSAFEIDLSFLIPGDSVKVEIFHEKGCKPKVLNNHHHGSDGRSISFSTITIDSTGYLHWTTENEIGKLPFIVEQYRWNKWIRVGEVDGIGTPGENSYRFQVKFHSGENKFRIKQIDFVQRPRVSKAVIFDAGGLIKGCSPTVCNDEITFTAVTLYEIYDAEGHLLKKGESNKIDISTLKKGAYYLNYDNKNEKFLKK